MTAAVKVRMTADEKIAALQKKIQQVKVLDEKQKLRELGDVLKKSSAQETRKKILVGGFILAELGDPAVLKVNNKRFADWLTRPDDRALFGIPPLELEKPVVTPPTPAAPEVAQRSSRYADELKAKEKPTPGFAEDALARARRLTAERDAMARTGRA